MNPRLSNISANAGRIYAAMVTADAKAVALDPWGVAKAALSAATYIEDAVEAAENARQDAIHKANEAQRS